MLHSALCFRATALALPGGVAPSSGDIAAGEVLCVLSDDPPALCALRRGSGAAAAALALDGTAAALRLDPLRCEVAADAAPGGPELRLRIDGGVADWTLLCACLRPGAQVRARPHTLSEPATAGASDVRL